MNTTRISRTFILATLLAALGGLQGCTVLAIADTVGSVAVKGVGLADEAPDRLREARAMVAATKQPQRIIVAADGGIREHTVPTLRRAGAETVVMGSLAFGAPDFAARIKWLHGLAAN